MPGRLNARLAAGVVCPLILLTGCGLFESEPSASSTRPASSQRADLDQFESEYRPIEAGSPGPTALSRGDHFVDIASALVIARRGRDRSAGEAAALAFAKLITDARPESPAGQAEMAAIAAPSLPSGVRAYLVSETDGQRAIRTGRHYDFRRGGYYRSQVFGSGESPERVSVEVAGLMRAPGFDYQGWYATRFDVTWTNDGGWRLVDFSDGQSGPYTTTLTRGQRQQFLTGPGWRALA